MGEEKVVRINSEIKPIVSHTVIATSTLRPVRKWKRKQKKEKETTIMRSTRKPSELQSFHKRCSPPLLPPSAELKSKCCSPLLPTPSSASPPLPHLPHYPIVSVAATVITGRNQ